MNNDWIKPGKLVRFAMFKRNRIDDDGSYFVGGNSDIMGRKNDIAIVLARLKQERNEPNVMIIHNGMLFDVYESDIEQAPLFVIPPVPRSRYRIMDED